MKAVQKTITLILLAVVDCIVGGVVIYDTLTYTPEVESTKEAKMLKLNDALVGAKESLAFVPEEEIKEEIKEEKKVVNKKQEETNSNIVYDGMTLDQLATKLNKSLKSTISGKGYLIASYSLEKGVDPYIATAIMLHETGCKWGCSKLVKKCNNVGGQKGKGCGSYRSFKTLDDGIKGFIDNLSKNYFSKGLTTPEQINKKYASDKGWAKKVNSYVKSIRNA